MCSEPLTGMRQEIGGELSGPDKEMNEHALSQGGRVLSRYTDRNGNAFYIISENLSGVNHTTVMLPDDY